MVHRRYVFYTLNTFRNISTRWIELHSERPLNEVVMDPKLTMNKTSNKLRPCLVIFQDVVKIISSKSF